MGLHLMQLFCNLTTEPIIALLDTVDVGRHTQRVPAKHRCPTCRWVQEQIFDGGDEFSLSLPTVTTSDGCPGGFVPSNTRELRKELPMKREAAVIAFLETVHQPQSRQPFLEQMDTATVTISDGSCL